MSRTFGKGLTERLPNPGWLVGVYMGSYYDEHSGDCHDPIDVVLPMKHLTSGILQLWPDRSRFERV